MTAIDDRAVRLSQFRVCDLVPIKTTAATPVATAATNNGAALLSPKRDRFEQPITTNVVPELGVFVCRQWGDDSLECGMYLEAHC
jgi:hypothetical protein